MIGLDGGTKDQCIRIIDGISDPADIDERNESSVE